MDKLGDPVVIGALFLLAGFTGIWIGHVMTFRTAYYFRIWRERGEGEDDG